MLRNKLTCPASSFMCSVDIKRNQCLDQLILLLQGFICMYHLADHILIQVQGNSTSSWADLLGGLSHTTTPQEVRIRTVTWWLSSAWFVGNWLVINTGSSHVPCNCFKVMAIIHYMHTLSYSSSLQNNQSQPNFLWKFLVVLDTDTSHLPTESCHHYDASSLNNSSLSIYTVRLSWATCTSRITVLCLLNLSLCYLLPVSLANLLFLASFPRISLGTSMLFCSVFYPCACWAS